jgi:hypothetical protein
MPLFSVPSKKLKEAAAHQRPAISRLDTILYTIDTVRPSREVGFLQKNNGFDSLRIKYLHLLWLAARFRFDF